jgi:hypothetical protein
VNWKDQRQLEYLRRGVADTTEQVAKSQEAIEGSLALLQDSDRMPVAQKPELRRPIRTDVPG